MANQHSPNEGLSLRELILELRADIRGLDKKLDDAKTFQSAEFQRVDLEISRRPTRAEVISWFTLAGVLSGGIAVAISQVIRVI